MPQYPLPSSREDAKMNAELAETRVTTIEDVRKAAVDALNKMRSAGLKQDFIATVEQPMREVVELSGKFSASRQKLAAMVELPKAELPGRIAHIAAQAQQGMREIVAAMRFSQQITELQNQLYRPPAESKGNDATLDFFKLLEVRTVLRGKPTAEVADIYQQSLESGNQLVVRAIESDPFRSLVSIELVEQHQQRRAELDNPELARKLSEIRHKQQALNDVVNAATRMME
ncbi:MAG: hypothetical protein U1F34_02900 [Gammaproteobacteria bacterium]